jgi:hypothetical protein
MLAYHLCMNLLQFFNLMSLLFVMVKFTQPDQSCTTMLKLYLNGPYHCMAVFILALIDQCMSYFVCYRFSVANSKMIQVTTGMRVPTLYDEDVSTSDISVYQS